jgi:hypothetical protein
MEVYAAQQASNTLHSNQNESLREMEKKGMHTEIKAANEQIRSDESHISEKQMLKDNNKREYMPFNPVYLEVIK